MDTQSVEIDPALVPIRDGVWQRIANLEQAMLKQDPLLAGHCKAIHTELTKYEELVHLLDDDQIRQIIVAQTQVTGTILVTKVKKASEASINKQAKGIKAEDL
jgi:hypothetical protein